LMLNGMRADRSWAHPGREYLNIYEHVKHKHAAATQPHLDNGAAAPHRRTSPERVRSRGAHRTDAART
jgi:hypothetical protein